MNLDFEMSSLDIEIPVRLSGGKIQTFNVREELEITESNLSNDFMEQAGKYAWWAVLAETAKFHKEKTELEVDVAEANADKTARKELIDESTKVTEALVKSRIKLNLEYQDAVAKFNTAKKNASILDKIVKSFEHRKEMLISVGAQIRAGQGNSGDLVSLKSRVGDITSR